VAILPAQIDEDPPGTVICTTQIEDDGTQTVTRAGQAPVRHPATADTLAMVAAAKIASNRQAITAAVAGALTRLRAVRTQMATVQAGPLTTIGQCAAAIKTEAAAIDDLTLAVIRLGRCLAEQFDGTT
jgi:hypothetical protein